METKERILVKAHELFNRYGIRSVSMDDISSQLGMSKKTLYQYYTDKHELVDAVFTAVLEEHRKEALREREVAENALHEVFLAFDRVRIMFANMNPSVLYDMQKYHPATFKKFEEFKNVFLYQLIKENLEWGIKEGIYRAEIDADILTRYRISGIMLSFNSEVFPNNRTHLIHIEQQLLEHFLYGLVNSKGLKLMDKYKLQRTQKIHVQ